MRVSKLHIYYNTLHKYLRQFSKRINLINFIFRFLQFFVNRPKERSMNLLAKAIYDYWKGNNEVKLYIHQNCLFPLFSNFKSEVEGVKQIRFNGIKFNVDLSRYFRGFNELDYVEKKLINLANGEILDIGCSTGYYMKELSKRGNVFGIDISKDIVNIAHEQDISNCYVGDIFRVKWEKKFDTITLIECDLGIAGSIYGLKRFLKKMYAMLNKGGQILTVMEHVQTLKYWHIVFTFEYKGCFSAPFRWVCLNLPYFFNLCRKIGFKPSLIENENSNANPLFLVRLFKKNR